MHKFALVLLAVLSSTAAGHAQVVPILLNGQIWDGNGGPLVSSSVYHIVGGPGNCGISVPLGQTLTIQPGTVVKVDGCFTVAGHLQAVGSPMAPIAITSVHDDSEGGDSNGNGNLTVPSPGDWGFIEVLGTANLEYCRIRYGGGMGATLALRNNPATIRHCDVQWGLGDGIRDALSATIEDCDFDHLGGIPVHAIDFKRLPQFNDNRATFCAGGEYARITDAIQLTGNITMDPKHSINSNGVFVLDTFNTRSPRVPPGVTLTLPAGTVLKFSRSSGTLTSSGGTIDMQGTAAQPVVLTSIDDDSFGGDTENNGSATVPAPGDWQGIQLQSGDTSSLTHTIVRYGGGAATIRLSGSSAVFDHCTFELGGGDGVQFNAVASPPAILRDCSIRDNAGRSLTGIHWTELEAARGNTTSNNAGGDQFQVNSGFVTAQVTIDPGNYPGEVLEVANRITLNPGGSLTFEAGVVLKWTNFNFNTGISVNGGGILRCNGTARRPVVFTSMRDDSVGGDTNGDGNATVPAPGDWEQVSIMSSSLPAQARLENVRIRYAGRSTQSLDCWGSAAELLQVSVEYSGSAGMRLSALQGSLDNAVVIDAVGDGLQLNGGTFDVRHATVSGCGGAGLVRTGSWSGSVRNSISWNNAGGNFGNLVVADVHFSDGGFAGSNGNLNVDPQFQNAAVGDLRLQATSPCLGAAETTVAMLVQKDNAETSRLQDHGLTGSLLPDMGAFERAPYTMSVGGDPILGTTMTFTLFGPSGFGALFASVFPPTGTFVPPFGFALIGFPNAPLASLLQPGQSAVFVLPNAPSFHGVEFDVQGIGVQVTGPLVGGFTNMDRNRLRM